MSSFSHHVLLYLRTLYIVWSLVRRRVTRRLTRLQTMHNVLKYSKTLWENDDISIYRYRTGIGNKLNLIMRMTVIRLQEPFTLPLPPSFDIDRCCSLRSGSWPTVSSWVSPESWDSLESWGSLESSERSGSFRHCSFQHRHPLLVLVDGCLL